MTQLPWEQARQGVEVKILPEGDEIYVLAKSQDRISKERAMRRRQLKKLWARLKELKNMEIKRDALLMKLGAARQQSPSAWRLVKIQLPDNQKKFEFHLLKDKLRDVRRREGRYLLRSNMPERVPSQLWEFYLKLVQIEEVFKQIKSDLAIRPIFHKKEELQSVYRSSYRSAKRCDGPLRGRYRRLLCQMMPRGEIPSPNEACREGSFTNNLAHTGTHR